ncbi:hypothetical protein ACA910_004495 [Epithemia clementina (nom. ined.)]
MGEDTTKRQKPDLSSDRDIKGTGNGGQAESSTRQAPTGVATAAQLFEGSASGIHCSTGNKQASEEETMVSSTSGLVPRLHALDVLLGRGNVRWEGNRRFQVAIKENARRYHDAYSRTEKNAIIFEIIAAVQAWGGRFLQPPSDTKEGSTAATATSSPKRRRTKRRRRHYEHSDDAHQQEWTVANSFQVRKKIGQALRYQMSEQMKNEEATTTSSQQEEAKYGEEQEQGGLKQKPLAAGDQRADLENQTSGSKKRKSRESGGSSAVEKRGGLKCKSSPLTSSALSSSTERVVAGRLGGWGEHHPRDGNHDNDKKSIASKDGSDAADSLDISVLLDLMDVEEQNHHVSTGSLATAAAAAAAAASSQERRQDAGLETTRPLLSNREILLSLGYDYDALVNEQQNIFDGRILQEDEGSGRKRPSLILLSDTSSNRKSEKCEGFTYEYDEGSLTVPVTAIEPTPIRWGQHHQDQLAFSTTNPAAPAPQETSGYYAPEPAVIVASAAKREVTTGAVENDEASCDSLDVSLSAILHVELQEEMQRKRTVETFDGGGGASGGEQVQMYEAREQQVLQEPRPPLLDDTTILSFLKNIPSAQGSSVQPGESTYDGAYPSVLFTGGSSLQRKRSPTK